MKANSNQENQEKEKREPEKRGRYRQYPGPLDTILKVAGGLATLFLVLYISGALGYLGMPVLVFLTYNAIFVAVITTLCFLYLPASKNAPRDRLPWYDALLIVAGLTGSIYVAVNGLNILYYGRLVASPLEMIMALLTIGTLVEATRRFFGWAIVIIVAVFILYAKFGHLIPGRFEIYPTGWSQLAADIYLSRGGIFGELTSIASGVILSFITFGIFFVAAGGGNFFIKVAMAFTGHMQGGPAKAAIVGSALFGTVSGSGAANVIVTGTTTIPLMKSVGYKGYYAGAIEAIASTGGAITPPVMAGLAFMMASFMQVPYVYVVTIAILPALLYFISLYMQVHLHAAKMGISGLARKDLPTIRDAIKSGGEWVIPIIVLMLLLFVFRFQAETSAIWSIGSVILVSMFRREHRITLNKFITNCLEAMRAVAPVGAIIALASVMLAVLTITGLGPKISADIITIFGGNLLFLLIASAVVCYILGMGISFNAAYILVIALVGPVLIKLGVPLVAAHFFVAYMVISTNFTPPYCPASFVAASIADAKPFRVGYQAMRLGIVTFLIPIVIAYNPALLLIGTPAEITIAAITAVVGIIAVSAALEGYFWSNLNWVQRIAFGAGGLGMFVPGVMSDLIGIGLIVPVMFWHWTASRSKTGLTSVR